MEQPCFNGSSKRILRSTSVTKEVEGSKKPKHSNRKASFIKLLVADFSKQLQIPHEFVTVFIGNVPHRFIIESAMTKECWRVEVEEDEDEDGAIYLREGWADFVKAHSLELGDILLFEYEEQSIFSVKVYNQDGCQKTAVDARGGKNNPVKIVDPEEQEEQEETEAFKCQMEILRTDRSRQELTKKLFTGGNGVNSKKRATLRKHSHAATLSQIEDNMAFSVNIDKHRTYQFKQLTVPKAISVAKLAHKMGVTLENAMGDRWPVKLSHIKDGRVTFTRGWNEFLLDNQVAAGDSLSFKFISEEIIKVFVKKAPQVERDFEEAKSPNGAPITPQNMDSEFNELSADTAHVNLAEASITPKRSQKRCSPELSSSSFSIFCGPKTPGSYLFVPRAISIAKLSHKKGVTLENAMGDRWPAKLSHIKDGRVALTRGWKEFSLGNQVAPGDSLSFKFISDDIIKVIVTKAQQLEWNSEEAKSPSGATLAPQDMDCEFDELNAGTAHVNLAEASITVKRSRKRCAPELSSSSFSFLWGPATPGDYLHVPKIVTEGQNLKNKKGKVLLRDPDGKCWPVEMTTRRDGRVALTKGWAEFWKGHGIKAGDSLDFDFISECLIQVMIHRGKLPESPAIIEEDIIDLCTTNFDESCPELETVMAPAETVMTGPEQVMAPAETVMTGPEQVAALS